VSVLRAAAEADGGFDLKVETFPWGCEHYLATGEVMPADGLETLRAFDALYFGATGHPDVDDYLSAWRFIMVVRQAFEQYVNLRPVKLLPGVPCPLANRGPDDVDFVIVRENTEGEFAGPGGEVHAGHSEEMAIQVNVFTRHGVERIGRYAFELARKRRNKVTNITKSNALQHGLVFWDRVLEEARADYPDVEYETLYVDAATMNFVRRPERFDVIVTTNLFGDILSDLGGAIMGGIGLGPSGNINPERNYPSMFEPIHGSAPDIAGQGIANPIGTIWAGALMLEHLGETQAAKAITQAIADVVREGPRPQELGGQANTEEVGQAIADRVARLTA
jgi:tartrate dehydrogenase/decarboxylase/D-malate dehydrogenase